MLHLGDFLPSNETFKNVMNLPVMLNYKVKLNI